MIQRYSMDQNIFAGKENKKNNKNLDCDAVLLQENNFILDSKIV